MTSTDWTAIVEQAKASGTQTYGPVPEGDYHLKIMEAEKRTTQNNKPYFNFKTQVQTGPHAGRIIWDELYLSDNGWAMANFFFPKFKILGLSVEFFQGQPTDEQICSAVLNKEFIATVKIDAKYNPQKPKNKIDSYKPLQAVSAAGFVPPAPQAAPAYQAPAVAPVPQGPPQAFPTQAVQPPFGAPEAVQQAPAAAPWETAAQAQQAPFGAPAQAPAPAGAPWDTGAQAAPAAPAPAPTAPVQFPSAPF